MANISVTIRMDEELKKESDRLFDEMGMTLSTAVSVFLRQAVREQGMPFKPTTKEEKNDVKQMA